MRYRFTLFLLFFVLTAGAQIIKNQMGALYPGGVIELKKFVNKNIDKPVLIREFGIGSRLILQFSVDENGIAKNGIFLGAEDFRVKKMAKKVVRKMPRFKPAKVHGSPSKSDIILDIKL